MPPRRHVTPRMLTANRANARLSTGPRTAAGKARSRANGLRHGLRASVLVPPLLESDEDRAAFASLVDALRAQFAPASSGEDVLVLTLVLSCFALRRAILAEGAAIMAAARSSPETALPPGVRPAQTPVAALPVCAMKASVRYEAPWQRCFWQSLDILLDLQLRRRLPRLGAALAQEQKQPNEPDLHASLRVPPAAMPAGRGS